MIELRVLRQQSILNCQGGTTVITRVLKEAGRRLRVREGEVTMAAAV